MENQENGIQGAGEAQSQHNGPAAKADCGCQREERAGHSHAQAQSTQAIESHAGQGPGNAPSGMHPAIFAIFGLAILFGGYMLFGIMQGPSVSGCSAGNTAACPLGDSITSANQGGAQAGNPSGAGGAQGGAAGNSEVQDIYIRALSSGTYDKSQIQVQKGVPVRLHFSADPNTGCGRQLVIYGLNVRAISRNGEESTVDFTPSTSGTYEYNCGMRMFRGGRLVVA